MRSTCHEVSSPRSVSGQEEANLKWYGYWAREKTFAIYGVQEALTLLFIDQLLRESKWEMCLALSSLSLLLFCWSSALYSMYGSTRYQHCSEATAM